MRRSKWLGRVAVAWLALLVPGLVTAWAIAANWYSTGTPAPYSDACGAVPCAIIVWIALFKYVLPVGAILSILALIGLTAERRREARLRSGPRSF